MVFRRVGGLAAEEIQLVRLGRCDFLNVGFHQAAVPFHPGPAGGGFALAHEESEGLGHFLDRFPGSGERHQAPGVGAQRRFPELVLIHFAEALEAGDGNLVVRDLLVLELL